MTALAAESHLTESDYLRIKVRRNFIWEDAKIKSASNRNKWNKQLEVQFVGEPAVDEGGPRHEFVIIVHRSMHDSCLFYGIDGLKCFTHNFVALKARDFELYGKFCVWTILQGCTSPNFFAPPVVDYILYGTLEKVSFDVEYIPDRQIRDKLKELDSITDRDDFQREAEASRNTDIRFDCGYSKPIVKYEDKEDLFHAICMHSTILASQTELNQFIDGLKLYNALDIIRAFPDSARSLLQNVGCKKLSAEDLDKLFTFELSPVGSNRRQKEEAIVMNFTRYLEDVEEGSITSVLVDPDTNEEINASVNLSQILQFVTGAAEIPPLRFKNQPRVVFNHVDPLRKLEANTCALQLCLPAKDKMTENDSFKEESTDCILNSPGFGKV